LGEEYRSFSSLLWSFLHSPVTSSFLGPNTFLNTLFSNALSLRSSLNVSDQVSHPYKTTGKIIVLYILIFKFLESNLEDNTNLKKVGYSGSPITVPLLLQGKMGKVFPAHAVMSHGKVEVLVHSLLTSTPDGDKRSA
jgi:hypothetical protein